MQVLENVESFLEEVFYENIIVDFELGCMVRSVIPQFKLYHKRYDFALEVVKGRFLLIECDSEKWHSDKEAVINDFYKDCLAEVVGMKLLRFTYKEIINERVRVADKIEAAIEFLKY